jgi:hypothetical protein
MKLHPFLIAGLALAPLPVLAANQNAEIHHCKAIVQGRIDVLDADMHKGDKTNQAHKLLKRRDRLKAQYADCEKNPKAYKKDL